MSILPKEIKLTLHAQQRLLERSGSETYDTKNLMKSSVKWYGKDDLIKESSLYIHCMYVCRKAKNKMGYITDGNIEVLYDKGAKVAITILEVKDKFKPVTQYIKPEYLKKIELKKERKRMRKSTTEIKICPDCGKEAEVLVSGIYAGLCDKCKTRKQNMKYRNKEYIPYKDLPEEKRNKIDSMSISQGKRHLTKEKLEESKSEIELKVPANESYYQAKATGSPIPMKPMVKPVKKVLDPLSDQFSFIKILREYGCEIPEENLKEVLEVLLATDKLKDILMVIAKNDNQDAMLNLEQALTVIEKKLRYDWEYNGFQEVDDIKFKGFLTWRRVLKGAIFFWKKLYQTNAIIEMQKVWNTYTTDPNDKQLLPGDRINTTQKRFQITTESISTIFNTRRPFTRVFFAASKEEAYDKFVKWMAERQLHEDKSKTTIVELSNEGEKVNET